MNTFSDEYNQCFLDMNEAFNELCVVQKEADLNKILDDVLDELEEHEDTYCMMIAETNYQKLISKYSPAYLSGSDWYVGPSLIQYLKQNDSKWNKLKNAQKAGVTYFLCLFICYFSRNQGTTLR